VYATFECIINYIDEGLREKISRELYERRKAEIGHSRPNVDLDYSDEEDLIGYDAIEPGLPPASSDRQRWWLDNGKMAQSGVSAPRPVNGSTTVVLNPSRPSNPFAPTDEPDWVAVPRAGSRLGSFSSISSSPYEHINHSTVLSTSASSSGPRKLPPPLDASTLPAKVGRINLMDDDIGGQSPRNETPPPPPPRRQTAAAAETTPKAIPVNTRTAKPTPPPPQPRRVSTASQASSKSKAPPPVAKKPTHLASTSPLSSPSLPSLQKAEPPDEPASRPHLPQRASTNIQSLSSKLEQSGAAALTGGMHKSPPPVKPKRIGSALSGGMDQKMAGGVSLPGMVERKPVLPNRPQQGSSAPPPKPAKLTRKPVMDLLEDNGDAGEMNGWETLRPS
jgi:synaptojanin